MRIRFILLLAAVLLCAGGGVYLFGSGMYRPYLQKLRGNAIISGIEKFIHKNGAFLYSKKTTDKNGIVRSDIENNILDRLKSLEIADSAVTFRKFPGDTAIEIRAALPRGRPFEWVVWHLSTAASGTSYRVDDCTCAPDNRGCTIRFTSTVSGRPVIVLSATWASRYFSESARLAIVIKDFGFAADKTTIDYLSFPEPLTVALVPSRKLSSWTAQISKEYKKEIIVLQPMEPAPAKRKGAGAACIMIHYPEERLRSIVAGAAAAVPNFAGFCNSGGARVLEDSRVTNIVFSEIKKRHGYFIEEAATRKSVAPAIARSLSLPYASIDVTIDTTLKLARVQELIDRYAAEAQKCGSSIICSKATDVFIRALKNELPRLKKNGIRLSYVSELLSPAPSP
jgi:polysaccharide deacetylase 2 family uncharacterized protein YibQ